MEKEKKEIGMEKLIRLINEYGHISNCGPFETCRLEPATEWNSSYLVLSRDDNGEGDWKDWHLEVPRLISKEYGFIGWLVENDKIDLGLYREYMPNLGEDFSVESNIIMNLSIAIDPIGYLNYILK